MKDARFELNFYSLKRKFKFYIRQNKITGDTREGTAIYVVIRVTQRSTRLQDKGST